MWAARTASTAVEMAPVCSEGRSPVTPLGRGGSSSAHGMLLDTYMLLFFFPSRRRHTRFKCDWSSDVCSSDLYAGSADSTRHASLLLFRRTRRRRWNLRSLHSTRRCRCRIEMGGALRRLPEELIQIGRASCRERV